MPADPALDPENRRLYGEMLRPPAGYSLEMAAATTYSLDFETAMVIPATMAVHAAETRQETLDSPIALLEGLERMSHRLAIFCEAGRIQGLAGKVSRLCGLLEDTLTEVIAPRGGAFHPKLWVMRFKARDPGAPVLMRMALLSRNLTRDTSWDLCLVLDGSRGETATTRNDPIRDLLRALPDMAHARPAPSRARAIVDALASDLVATTWTLPEGFREVSFAVNGLSDQVWRPRSGHTQGIVSPFCDAAALKALVGRSPGYAHLVSRADQLDLIPANILQRFDRISVLDDMAESGDGEDSETAQGEDLPARGLHAKAFITQHYSDTLMTVGSGNATSAALVRGDNVEVFATLRGRKKLVGGAKAHLSPERFGRLLRDYEPPDNPPDQDKDDAEHRLERQRRVLARTNLTLRCNDIDEAGRVGLTLTCAGGFDLDEGFAMTLWPVVLGENHGVAADILASGAPLELGRFALADVTRWLGLRLLERASNTSLVFSLGATLEELPESRNSEILRAFINNRDAFFRYLRFLLADGEGGLPTMFERNGKGGWEGAFASGGEASLLERLVAALGDDTNQLDEVDRLIERLGPEATTGAATGTDNQTAPLIPQAFLTLWAAFQAVRADD